MARIIKEPYYRLKIINYPNEFDKSKTNLSDINKLGGDIFIHGNTITIGCIPIGDLAIEEVFMLAQKAISQQIPIIIAPRDFRQQKSFPSIEKIDWENELYRMIEEALKNVVLD